MGGKPLSQSPTIQAIVARLVALEGAGLLTPEAARDLVAAFLVQGANITLVHNDGADTLTISASGGGGGAGDMLKADNLSGLASNDTALANLGGGTGTGGGRSVFKASAASDIRTLLALGSAALATTGSAAGNVPVLDGSAKLPTSILPSVAVTDTFTVASQAAMLALAAERGDVAIRTDLSKAFILSTDNPGTLADWKELLTPADVVQSVAGLTGAISASNLRTALSLVVGTDVQAYDADLAAIATLATTSYGRALLTLADAAALTALGNTFTSTLKGLVPASGGGTTNFLRADGTWAAPSGGGSSLREQTLTLFDNVSAIYSYYYARVAQTVTVYAIGNDVEYSKSTTASPNVFGSVSIAAVGTPVTGITLQAGASLRLRGTTDINVWAHVQQTA